jgi:DNA-binding response OmpR family regulator
MLRILLVDDSDADVVLLREGFRRSGIAADVQLVQNSEQALRLLADSTKPDFLLLDTHLPRLDAITILKHCGSPDGAPPVIMVNDSSNDDECERWCALKRGGLDCITKPPSFVPRLNVLGERRNVGTVSSAAKRRKRSSRERAAAPRTRNIVRKRAEATEGSR